MYYRTPRVYISMSEHEGFCVPLVEAMAADVPVLAYAAAAVPDTLGGAGVAVRAEGHGIRRRAAGAAGVRRRPAAGSSPDSARRRSRRPAASSSSDDGGASESRELRDDPLQRRCEPVESLGAHRETRLHRPALRHRGSRRIRASLPADRRAARAEARRRRADDLRARLRHLEKRVSGRDRPRPRRHGPALRHARTRDIDAFNRYSDWIFTTRTRAPTRWSG